jgi:NAD kinase
MENILIVKKTSSLEHYYGFNNISEDLHKGHEENGNSIKKIETILRDNKIKYNTVTRENLINLRVEEYDAVISAGGDGTVIAVGAYNINTPQLNLKTDSRSKGALCCKDIEKSLESMLNGDFFIENWSRQDVYLNGRFVSRALNETCICEGTNISKMAKYDISFEDKYRRIIEDYHHNSGIVIVTGTGSTGWPYLFQAYDREDKSFKFKTNIPNIGNINSGEFLECSITYKNHNGKFVIDTIEYNFPRDSVLEIKQSILPLKVIKPKV